MERGRIIVNNTDYTGSFVTPNPSEPPTKDLNTLEIEGEVFNIAGSGGGGVGDITNYYGVFIDTNNIIQSFVHITDTAEHTYIATEDCAVVYYIPNDTNTDVYIKLDGIQVGGQYGQYINATSDIVYMKKGQVFSYQTTYTVSTGAGYTVYGLQSGDRIPALIQDAQIYSLEEKQVGVWTDGKPLYQKTVSFPANTSQTFSVNLDVQNVEHIFLVPDGCYGNDGTWTIPYITGNNYLNNIGGFFDNLGSGNTATFEFRVGQESAPYNQGGVLTFRYTKTTDEEGSGGYQAYGMSPVIYSTKEREIGVWIDNKPLYQKTFEKSISVTSTSRTWYTVITSSELRAIDADKIFIETSDSYIEDSDGLYEVNYSSIVGNAGGLMGGVYDKTTDVIQLCIAGVSAGTKTAKITIKYTKTTDSPKRTGYELLDIQENQIIVDATRYSTEEKIIGTWIDNKPLYQKTFLFNQQVITDNAWTNNILGTVGSGIEIVDFEGTFGLENINPHFSDFSYYRGSSEYFTAFVPNNNGSNDDIAVRPNMNAGVNVTLDKCTIWYTKTTDAAGSGGYQAYGFSPIIYSTEEREVGVWINNKPLYQKTLVFEDYTNGTYQDVSSLNIEEIVNNFGEHRFADYSYGLSFPYYENNNWYSLMTFDKNNGRYYVYCSSQIADAYKKLFITIQYTKTTDIAGSGEYNTLGIPNVHYDGNEKIIGTWFGETLYQKTLVIHNESTVSSDTTITTIDSTFRVKNWKAFAIENGVNYKVPYVAGNGNASFFFRENGNVEFTIRNTTFAAGSDFYITIEYTKTTD